MKTISEICEGDKVSGLKVKITAIEDCPETFKDGVRTVTCETSIMKISDGTGEAYGILSYNPAILDWKRKLNVGDEVILGDNYVKIKDGKKYLLYKSKFDFLRKILRI